MLRQRTYPDFSWMAFSYSDNFSFGSERSNNSFSLASPPAFFNSVRTIFIISPIRSLVIFAAMSFSTGSLDGHPRLPSIKSTPCFERYDRQHFPAVVTQRSYFRVIL